MKRYACMLRSIIERGEHRILTVQPSHIELIRQWRNAQLNVLRQAATITGSEQVDYYERRIWPTLDDEHPQNILLSFLHGERLVGYGGLVHIDWPRKNAELSFLLDPELARSDDSYRKHHRAYLSLIQDLAFEDLDLNSLTTETFPGRLLHMQNLESRGFARLASPSDPSMAFRARSDSIFHRCEKKNWKTGA